MKRLPQILATLVIFTAISDISFADQHEISVASVKAWLDGYEEAWEKLDPEKAAGLFTDDATYQENPYEAPHEGRQGIRRYWADVTSDQKDVDFSYDVLAVSGNTGIAYWHSEFASKSNAAAITLDGIFVLEFDNSGLCKSLKEWWHIKVDAAEANQTGPE